MLKRMDVDILDLGIVPDDPQALKQALQNAAQNADIIITSGGVSVGDADHIKPVLQETGKAHFWKIAMKPGRPLTFGQIGQAHFFGLPGNPVAVMVTFYQFVQPAIQTLAGEGSSSPLTLRAKCMTPLRKKPGRYEFLRGIYRQDDAGDFVVEKAGLQGSGILTSMSRANCFILLPEENDGLELGERVTIQPFTGLI